MSRIRCGTRTFFFSSRRRHTRFDCDWSSDVCSSDLRAFFPESLADLPQIANEIIRDLRTQYVIAYNPTNKDQDGTYRAIKVTVVQPDSIEKRIAFTRTVRLARKEGQGTPSPPAVRMLSTTTPNKKP